MRNRDRGSSFIWRRSVPEFATQSYLQITNQIKSNHSKNAHDREFRNRAPPDERGSDPRSRIAVSHRKFENLLKISVFTTDPQHRLPIGARVLVFYFHLFGIVYLTQGRFAPYPPAREQGLSFTAIRAGSSLKIASDRWIAGLRADLRLKSSFLLLVLLVLLVGVPPWRLVPLAGRGHQPLVSLWPRGAAHRQNVRTVLCPLRQRVTA